MKKKICILTLGCPKNIVDSENIFSEINSNDDFIWTENVEAADVILLNTCGFIQDAINETLSYIASLHTLKSQQAHIKIIVYGCAITRLLNENFPLALHFPLIEHFIPISQKDTIVTHLQEHLISTKSANQKKIVSSISNNLPYTYLKISDGCNRHCAFCTIPTIKGKYVSIPKSDIIAAAKQHIANGKKEIVLIGQETTNYGNDIGTSLFELVDELSAIIDLPWLRIMYAHPITFDLRLLELMKQRSNICKYIDIPLQHINDTILTKMGRSGSSKHIKQLINTIRNTVPGIKIRSTFITGFPGETKWQHNELLTFLQETKLDRVGIFKYSKEAHTPAASMERQVKSSEKQDRFDELMSAQQQISLALNKQLINQKVNVLVEQDDNLEYYIGRTEFDAPDIDCDVHIPKADSMSLQVGSIVQCLVTEAEHYSIKAKIIE